MNRLRHELHRLYLPTATPAAEDAWPASLIDGRQMVRALVMEIDAPASWEVLARVWQGVQAELGLPAPGIAVSGTDGLQLWFSLVDAIPAAAAHAFLDGLRVRFLPDIPARRVRMLPLPAAGPGDSPVHAALVPACQEATGNWSAFIASDLAPVFADTPWLDMPPGEEGQAGLLRGLQSAPPSAFAAAAEQLRAAETAAGPATGPVPGPVPVPAPGPPSAADEPPPAGPVPSTASAVTADATRDPESFLLRVMNDTTVALGHRIDAAKALLAFSDRQKRGSDDPG